MNREEIKKLIEELVERTTAGLKEVVLTEERPGELWVSVETHESHLFIARDGEGLNALNHLVYRLIEARNSKSEDDTKKILGIVVDVNGFQKKRVENIRAVAHMMSERARYFKSNIEVDPMSAFERRIVHEFLSEAKDLQTESVGAGRSRRVVIKYIGDLK